MISTGMSQKTHWAFWELILAIIIRLRASTRRRSSYAAAACERTKDRVSLEYSEGH